MKNQYETFNMFLESVHSGTKIFKMYRGLATDNDLLTLLGEVIDTFRSHEESLTSFLLKENVEPNDSLSFGREFLVFMEKLKTQMMIGTKGKKPKEGTYKDDDDFEIAINSLKGINMGTTKGLEFIYEHTELDTSILKQIIKDYSFLYDKISDFIVSKYLN